MSTTAVRRPPRAPITRREPAAQPRRREQAWARPALALLLLATAGAYIWNLTASGDANSFYAAAVQAGTRSWKAFFFGSLDTSNFITVDKPPASLWVMALSGRIFGFSSASMLIPQALEGVAAVALLCAGVKRWFGAGAGLLAGGVLAVTPVAALMFRFNNPDALLVCLLVAAAYCLVRALEGASTRWLLAVGTMIGFAFLAKMMQAFLVLPGFALVYLVAAPTGLRRRLLQLAGGALAIVVSAGWWVAIVALWPTSSRPMIDGSSTNSIFNLILGYNGLGRIFGSSAPGGGGGGANFSGPAGLLRLFNSEMGGQAAWLIPAALLALGLGLWSRRQAPRTDRARAAVILWGSWLVVSGLVFSLSSGIIHTYYTVALAPAIAALVAIGAVSLWRRRETLSARLWLAVAVLGTAAWAWVLLDRTPSWEPWLRPVILASAVLAAAALVAAPRLRGMGPPGGCPGGHAGHDRRPGRSRRLCGANHQHRAHRIYPVRRTDRNRWCVRGRARRWWANHQQCPGQGTPVRPLPLGGRRLGVKERRDPGTGQRWRTGHGHRWLRQPGRQPDPGPVQGLRGQARDPLLHRRDNRWRRRPGRPDGGGTPHRRR